MSYLMAATRSATSSIATRAKVNCSSSFTALRRHGHKASASNLPHYRGGLLLLNCTPDHAPKILRGQKRPGTAYPPQHAEPSGRALCRLVSQDQPLWAVSPAGALAQSCQPAHLPLKNSHRNSELVSPG